MRSSESLETTQKIADEYGDGRIIVECNIKELCFNAGKINKFGQSVSPSDEETLMPPYTVVKLISREADYVKVDVAQDNKNHNFTMANANL